MKSFNGNSSHASDSSGSLQEVLSFAVEILKGVIEVSADVFAAILSSLG